MCIIYKSHAPKEKNVFGDEITQEVLKTRKIIIEGDLNRHVVKGRQGSERVNRNWGFGERNEAEENFLMFSETYNLGIVINF